MIQNQPTASLRALAALLYDTGASPLPSGTSWLAGMTLISKANGAFVNTYNTPTAVSGGADNSFVLQLEEAETDTLGPLRIQFLDGVAGNLLAEYVDEVVVETDISTVPTASENADAVWETGIESSYSAAELLRLLVAVAAGDGDGLESTTPLYKNIAGDTTRVSATVDEDTGDRVITIVDLTP